eukprot:5071611-Amphidinium_carterae.1
MAPPLRNALLISSETDSWSNELRANVDMYAQGLYWSVSTMFSGASCAKFWRLQKGTAKIW